MTTPSMTLGPEVRVTPTLSQFFLDHAEFRHRADPLTEPAGAKGKSPDAEPSVNLRIGDDSKNAAVTVQAVSDNPAGSYIYSVAYVAVLAVDTEVDLNAESLKVLRDRIMISGAGMVMPFVREVLGNLTGRGRHGVTWLNRSILRTFSRRIPRSRQCHKSATLYPS